MVDQTAKNVTEIAKNVAEAATAPAAAMVSAATRTDAAKAAPAKAETRTTSTRTASPARKMAAKRNNATKPARKPRVAANTKSATRSATPSRKPVRAGANRNEGATIMNKQTKQNAEAGRVAADQLKNVFGDVNERAKVAAERSAKVAEEFAELTRGNVEALVASSKIVAKGVESISQDAAEYSRKAFEEASATFRSFAEVKSPTDFFKLQGDYARAAFDSAVAESARLSETVLKLAGDVAEPITSRYTVAAERVKTLAA
ncbi:MAG: phasin family protein [Allosphingosinicella sp.]